MVTKIKSRSKHPRKPYTKQTPAIKEANRLAKLAYNASLSKSSLIATQSNAALMAIKLEKQDVSNYGDVYSLKDKQWLKSSQIDYFIEFLCDKIQKKRRKRSIYK